MTNGMKNAAPFFDIVMRGLAGEIDSTDSWEATADDAIFEFMYHFDGFPVKFDKASYHDWFKQYDSVLESADGLRIYKADENVIIEYTVHGKTSAGKPYDNQFCSIVTIKNHKIVYWRDYMDTFAVVRANS